MDFTDFYSDTQTIELFKPGTDEVAVTIELRSPTSNEVKEADRKRIARQSRGKVPAKEQEAFGVERLCAFVASWKWADGLTFDGMEPDDSEGFKRKVFTSNSPASALVMSEILRAIDDIEGFTKG